MRLIIILFGLLSFASGTSAQLTQYCIEGRFSQDPYFEEFQIVADTDLVYGAAPRWPSATIDTLQLDIYYPALGADELAKRPFILLIHGGTFFAGNRRDMRSACMDFARRGFVAATMTYRLGWDCDPNAGLLACVFCGNQAPKLAVAVYRAVQDARAALRFVAANADQYAIDTDAFFIGGTSAGGITAMQTAFFTQEEADLICPDCVNQVGPLDQGVNQWQGSYHLRGVLNNCGAIVDLDVLDEEQPLPVINFHDDLDCLVPSQFGYTIGCLNCTAFFTAHGSQDIYAHLQQLQTCTELNLKLLSLNHCSFPQSTIVKRSSCFFKRLMCGECAGEVNNNEWAVTDCSALAAPVATREPRPGLAFSCFPNPAKNNLTIELKQPSTDEVSIQMFSLTGNRVFQHQSLPGRRFELPLPTLPAGLYLLQVTQSGQTGTERVVIQ